MVQATKTAEQIEQMRCAGRVVHGVLARLTEMCQPGVTTAQLDAEAARMLLAAGADGLFKDYPNHRQGGQP